MLRLPLYALALVLLVSAAALAWPRDDPGWAYSTCPEGACQSTSKNDTYYWCTTGEGGPCGTDPLKTKYNIYGIKANYTCGGSACFKCDWWRWSNECCTVETAKPDAICGQEPYDP
jgi:hypothetical protein